MPNSARYQLAAWLPLADVVFEFIAAAAHMALAIYAADLSAEAAIAGIYHVVT